MFDRDSIKRVAAAHIKKQADDPRWFAQQIESALGILEDAVDVADMPGGMSDHSGAVAQATTDIRRNISKRLHQHAKAVSRVRMAAGPLTLRQVKSLMKKHKIEGEVGGRGTSWEVELRDEATKRRFEKAMPSGYGFGGYRTGYGGWVLRPDYKPMGDWNDPSSRHHYAAEKTAASEVSLKALLDADPWAKKLIDHLAKVGLRRVSQVFSGIHGNILFYDTTGSMRLTPADLKKLGSLPKVRWFDFGDRSVSVGIEGSWIDEDED